MEPQRRLTLTALGSAAALAAGCGTAPASAPAAAPPAAPLPRVRFGRVERLAAFASRHVDARHVDVWLPPGYRADGPRHAVLYMHDGQMLFDAATTWNRQAWAVDAAAAPLVAAGTVRPFIVVGVWSNGPLRRAEYCPPGLLRHLQPPALRQRYERELLLGPARGDDYLRCLAEELKPAIDVRYATDPGRDATVLMGSSRGGLISVGALCARPDVFSAAAALSTHWIGLYERNEPFAAASEAWLREALPPPGAVRLYLDRGTTELDAQYDQAQARIDRLLAGLGWRAPALDSRVFEGTGHNERDWAARLTVPLRFLLGRG